MPGLESDVRAGGVRVSASDLVAKAADLTPAVELLADSFRKGQITAGEFLERYDSRGVAKSAAETETFQLQAKMAKAAQDPRLLQLRQAVEQGGLEAQFADMEFNKDTREMKQKMQRIQYARAMDEIDHGIPAEAVKQYALEYPEIVTPSYGPNGRIANPEEVKKQISHVARFQKFLGYATELSSQFDTQKVQLQDGREGVITVWKGTNQRVPPELVTLANNARVGRLTSLFGTPGQVPAPVAAAQAAGTPAAPVPAVPVPAAPAAPAPAPSAEVPGKPGFKTPSPTELGPIEAQTTKVGEVTPEGILVTGDPTRTNRLIPSEGMNKFFQVRMSVENVQDVASAYRKIREHSPNLIGVVKGRILGPALGEWDEWYKVLENTVQSTVPGMARGVFGEVGVLSNADIENYKKLLPTAKTDPDIAEKILADIMKKTNRAVNLIVDSYQLAGYDTSGFADLKQRAASEEQRLAAGGSAYGFPGGPGGPAAAPAQAQQLSTSIPRYRSISEVPPTVKVFQIEGEPTPRRRR